MRRLKLDSYERADGTPNLTLMTMQDVQRVCDADRRESRITVQDAMNMELAERIETGNHDCDREWDDTCPGCRLQREQMADEVF